MTRYVYIGSATPNDHAQGIFVYRLDTESGKLEKLHSIVSGANPSFLTMDPEKEFLFCVNESDEGAVSSFRVNHKDGSLAFINRVEVGAVWPCYLSLSADRGRLMTANYGSGSLTVLPVAADGRLGERVQLVRHAGPATDPAQHLRAADEAGLLASIQLPGKGSVPSGVIADRQESTHTHSVIFAPGGEFILAADLGADRVWVYRYNGERLEAVKAEAGQVGFDQQEAGWLDTPETGWTLGGHQVKPGSGPRHIVFHPNGRSVYVSNEMGSSVTVFAWNPKNGGLQARQNIGTLPGNYQEYNDVAHIAFRPDGKYLYVSNRGHNSVAVFAVDGSTGLLSPVGHAPTLGNWPRNFCIDPDGKFLLAANQKSGTVVVLRIDPETGIPSPSGESIEAPTPFFVAVVDLE